MHCPFRELHELYKIVYDKAEAHAKAEKEREEKERQQKEEEEREERRKKGLPPQLRREPPPDAKKIAKPSTPTPSPYEAEELEEMFEEMTGGGVL